MKRALVSVSDKTDLVPFVQGLVANDFEIVSTGGTKKVLEQAGIKTISVEDVTGFPEILDGRVKTLNPYIHGGLLARRDLKSHMETLKEQHITPIDLVCVNLYPFKETIQKEQIIGKMTEFCRNNKNGKTAGLKFKIYSHCWCSSFFIRKILLYIYTKFDRD